MVIDVIDSFGIKSLLTERKKQRSTCFSLGFVVVVVVVFNETDVYILIELNCVLRIMYLILDLIVFVCVVYN